MVSEFVKQAHRHPLFNLGLAVALSVWVTFSFSYFAVASEVSKLKSDLNSVSATVKRSALETRVHSLETEIFDLERLVDEGGARDRDYDRLSRLRSDLGTAERALARVDQLGDF